MSSSAPASADRSWTLGLRLPSTVVTSKYDVALAPDLEKHTFQGHVRITLQLTEAIDRIVLHSLDLTYPARADAASPDVKLLSAAGDLVAWVRSVELDDAGSQRACFQFGAPIPPGSYVLDARFDGILNDLLQGFYRSEYVSARDGKKKFMAVTQFEATDARRALPCVDEPAAKAVFSVQLVVEPSQCSISNMPCLLAETITTSAEEQRADPKCRGLVVPKNWIRYSYMDSPIMSTYLLAFVVGEFDYIAHFTTPTEGVSGSQRVEVRIYTPVGQTKTGVFAMDVAVKCLELYEKFFQVPYPLPKLDVSLGHHNCY
jgi:aminopeptidase N